MSPGIELGTPRTEGRALTKWATLASDILYEGKMSEGFLANFHYGLSYVQLYICTYRASKQGLLCYGMFWYCSRQVDHIWIRRQSAINLGS